MDFSKVKIDNVEFMKEFAYYNQLINTHIRGLDAGLK